MDGKFFLWDQRKYQYMQLLFSNTEQVFKKIEQENNSVVFSSLSEFYSPIYSTGFAVKYVLEGAELYKMDEHEYLVNAGNYLLSNSSRSGHVEIESDKKVKGICLNISPQLMMEVVASLRRPDTAYTDTELGQFFCTPYFPENNYNARETVTGRELSKISYSITQGNVHTDDLNIEFFYALSQKIVEDQLPVFKELQSLPGIKRQTKRELYKKICRGREMMDACFTSTLSVKSVAREACMSEFHFFRLFKNMTGISPHQYILQKRLALAAHLLSQQAISVSGAALECGFSDIQAFSKAFKKQFAVNPSAFREK